MTNTEAEENLKKALDAFIMDSRKEPPRVGFVKDLNSWSLLGITQVFEAFVANLVNRFLGDYVADLEEEQLDVAIWSGEVKLSKLKLRQDALEKFNLPFDVHEGYLQDLNISIPWANLKAKPVQISINGMYLLASSQAEQKYNLAEDLARQLKLKKDKIDAFEMFYWNSVEEEGAKSSQSATGATKKNESFVQSLTTKVIDNIQLNIKNIHIRYEDSHSNPLRPFGMGISLSSLTAVSTDSNYMEAFIKDSSTRVYKLVKLDSLSVYWDTCAPFIKGKSPDMFIRDFEELISRNGESLKQHQYLLKPVSGSCRLTLNKKYSSDDPKVIANLEFDEIGFSLDNEQYEDVQLFFQSLSTFSRSREFRKFRPANMQRPKENPREWWNFAIVCVKEKIHQQRIVWSWEYLKNRRDRRVKYLDLFKKKTLSPSTLSSREKSDLDDLEKDLSYFDIRLYRTIVHSAVKKSKREKKSLDTKTEGSGGWMSGWWKGSSSGDAKNKGINVELKDEDMKKLYEYIDFEADETSKDDLPAGSNIIKAEFSLKKGSICLKSNPRSNCVKRLIDFNFEHVTSSYTQKVKGFEFTAGLENIQVMDGFTEKTLFPCLIKGKASKVLSLQDSVSDLSMKASKFFEISISRNIPGSTTDWSIAMKMRPLQIVYNYQAINSLLKFFEHKSEDDILESLANEAQKRLRNISTITRAGWLYALEEHKTVDVNISLDAPFIIFPKDCTDPNSMMFLADLGSLKITRDSCGDDFKTVQQNTLLLSDQQLSELSYDKFKIVMNSFMLYHSNNLTVFQSAMRYNDESLKRNIVVEKIDFEIFLEKSIVPVLATSGRPDLKISGTIPSVVLNFSDLRYRHMMELLDLYFPSMPVAVKAPSNFQLNVLQRFSVVTADDSEADIDKYFSEAKTVRLDDENRHLTVVDDGKSEYFDAQSKASSSSSPSAPALNIQRFQIDVQILQMTLLAFKEDPRTSTMTLYADAGIQSVSILLLQRSFDLKIVLNLGSFVIEDKLVDAMSEDRLFFKSEEDSKSDLFLHMEYLKVDQNSPELFSIFKGIEQHIKIDLSSMQVFLRDKTLTSFRSYILNTFQKADNVKAKSLNSLTNESVSDILHQAPSSMTSKDLSMKFHLKSVTFLTHHDNFTFGKINLTSGSVNLVVGEEVSVSGKLRDFSIFDNINVVPFCHIEGDHVFDFIYQTKTSAGADPLLKIRSGSLVLTYQPSFIIRLQTYLEALQTSLPTDRLNEVIQLNQNNPIELSKAKQTNSLKLDVFVKTPIIALARNMTGASMNDPNHIYHKFQLGSIHLTNARVSNDQYPNDMQYNIKISEINLSESTGATLIEPIDVDLKIFNYTESEKRNIPGTCVRGKVSKATATMSNPQYQLIIDSLRYFLDTVTQVLPGPETDITSPGSSALKETSSESAIVDRQHKTDVRLRLRGFELVIKNCTSDGGEKGGIHPVCRLALNESDLKFCNFNDESMEMDLKIHSFAIEDIRPELKRVYRNILPPQNFEYGQLQIHYAKTDVGSQMMKITLDSPKVILIIDLVFALKSFFTDLPPPKPVPSYRVVPNVNAERFVSNTMFFMLNVIDAELTILENPESLKSEAIVLKFKKLVFSQQGNMSLNIDGVGMFLCNMDSKSDFNLRFVDDFDVSLTMEKSNVWIRSTPVTFRISYQDIVFVLSVISSFNKYSGSDSMTSSKVDVVELQLKSAASPGSSKIQNTVDASGSKVLSLDMEGFRVLLFDDVSDTIVPFLDFEFDQINTDVSDYESWYSALVNLNFEVSHYNIRNSNWEPLFEKWSCKLNLRNTKEEGLLIDLDSNQTALVNISQTFIRSAMILIEEMKKKDRPVSAIREVYAPYVIINQTGYPLVIWADGISQEREFELVELANGVEKPWNAGDWRRIRDAKGGASFISRDRIAVQIKGDKTWETVRNVSLENEGFKIYPLRPKQDVSHKLVVDISLVKTVKYVRIRSSVVLRNATSLPLEFILTNNQGQILTDPVTIDPNKSGSIPVDSGYYHSVKIRPIGRGYKWCNQRIFWKDIIDDDGQYDIECIGETAGTVSFFYRLEVRCDKQSTLINDYPFLQLVLHAPLEIENLLPYDIFYKLTEKSGTVEFSGILTKGQVNPVYNMNPENTVAISFSIVGTDFKSDIAIINAAEYDYTDEKIECRDKNGAKLELLIAYEQVGEFSNASRAIIYSPYVILNRTELPLVFCAMTFIGSKVMSAGQSDLSSFVSYQDSSHFVSKPILFSYPDFELISNRACFKLADSPVSEWSEPVSFEAVGSYHNKSISSSRKNTKFWFTIGVEQGGAKYFRSKFINIIPQFTIKNNLAVELVVQQYKSDRLMHLKPGEKKAFHSVLGIETLEIRIKRRDVSDEWSSPFPILLRGKSYLKMSKKSDLTVTDLVQVDSVIENRSFAIIFSDHKGLWPFIFQNDTDHTLSLFQKGTDAIYSIEPGQNLSYAWDRLDYEEKRIILGVGSRMKEVNILEIGVLPPISFVDPETREKCAIVLNIVASGLTITIEIKDFDEQRSLYSFRRRSRATVAESPSQEYLDEFDPKQVVIKQNWSLTVNLSGIGISLVDKDVKEVIFALFQGLKFRYWDTDIEKNMNATIKWLQVDNQTHGSQQPIALYPSIVSRQSNSERVSGSGSSSSPATADQVPPFFEVSIFKLKDTTHGVDFYKYLGFLLQEVSVDVEETLIRKIVDVWKFDDSLGQSVPENVFEQLVIPEPNVIEALGLPIYFEHIELNPMKINFSFTKAEIISDKRRKFSISNPWTILLDTLLATFGNVHDAPILLPAIIQSNLIVNQSILISSILSKYKDDVLGQFHKFIGSADFLGNPIGLFNNIASGAQDVFYEPMAGFVKNDPRQMGIGFFKGGASLFSKTVYGLSDAFSKFTGSVGKGLSVITLDSKYQKHRRTQKAKNKPKNALTGVTSGTKNLITSVASGISGIIEKPVEGAAREGFGGFIKGIGKGIVGVVTKPVIGIFDLASDLGEGIKNTTVVFDDELTRIRFPRVTPFDRILRPYKESEALGQFLLLEADEGAFLKDYYIGHVEIRSEGNVSCIVSSNRIVLVSVRDNKTVWQIPFSHFKSIKASYEGVTIYLQDEDLRERFLPLPDYETSNYLVSLVNEAIAIYNQENRPLE